MTTFLPMLYTIDSSVKPFLPCSTKNNRSIHFYLPKKNNLPNICLTAILPVCLSVPPLFISLSSCLSVYGSVCLFSFPSQCTVPPTHLVHCCPAYKCLLAVLPVLSVCLSMTSLVLSVCLPVCLIIDMSVFLKSCLLP